MTAGGDSPLLDISGLRVAFPTRGWRRPPVEVLHGVDLAVPEGRTLGLVGESGSGKSTIGRAVLGLVPVAAGSIRWRGQDVVGAGRAARRDLSSEIQVVFQDPYTSLNPSMTIADILSEPLRVTGASRQDAASRVRELLDQIALPADAARRLPREFSGGQRQRIAIARALCRSPRLVVCDEPVSALDLSTQARVLDLFVELQDRTGVSYLFISHDLSVVRHISHEVAVLYRGDVVEHGEARQVTERPSHPYTKRLLMSAPVPDPVEQAQRRAARWALTVT